MTINQLKTQLLEQEFTNKNYWGKWKLVCHNFDENMKVPGVSFANRQVGNVTKRTVIISQEGGKAVMRTPRTFKNTGISFHLREKLEETTPDNSHCKYVESLDGDKLIHVQKWDGCGREERKGKKLELKILPKMNVEKHFYM
uniref:Lipocalin/cytosolic fatty-acid binding domain-containing protein n=1 Tax=Sarcophilus harrisii TaxID=9305 RepID=A0A7N4NTP7_SARHA